MPGRLLANEDKLVSSFLGASEPDDSEKSGGESLHQPATVLALLVP
jgi:hypothetical protein